MFTSVQEPEEKRVVDFRMTLPVVVCFVLTMLACYLLGEAATPYYLANSQIVRVDVISRPAGE